MCHCHHLCHHEDDVPNHLEESLLLLLMLVDKLGDQGGPVVVSTGVPVAIIIMKVMVLILAMVKIVMIKMTLILCQLLP